MSKNHGWFNSMTSTRQMVYTLIQKTKNPIQITLLKNGRTRKRREKNEENKSTKKNFKHCKIKLFFDIFKWQEKLVKK